MPRRRALFDFGFDPVESPYHFVVETGETTTLIAERYAWPPEGDDSAGQPDAARQPALKVALSRYRWGRVAEAAADVFNRRLRAAGFRPAAWKPGETLLAPYFGKELTLLLWAIEDADATVIPNMLANWLGLAPEERWWLYTTINATAGHPEYGKDKGWRKAIKIAFAENPAALPPSSLLNGDAALREPRDPYRVLPPAPPPTPSRRRKPRRSEPGENQIELPSGEDHRGG